VKKVLFSLLAVVMVWCCFQAMILGREYACDNCGRRYSMTTEAWWSVDVEVVDLDTGENLLEEYGQVVGPNRYWCSDRCARELLK